MVGKHDGSSSQYDHELKLKKDWPAPTILTEPQQGKALPKTKPKDTENVHFVSVHFKVREKQSRCVSDESKPWRHEMKVGLQNPPPPVCINSFITVGRFSGAADLLPLSPDFLLEA